MKRTSPPTPIHRNAATQAALSRMASKHVIGSPSTAPKQNSFYDSSSTEDAVTCFAGTTRRLNYSLRRGLWLPDIHLLCAIVARSSADDAIRRRTFSDALIPRVRNALVAAFLASESSHLLFVDADTGFEPSQITAMLDFDRDFVAGAVPLKEYFKHGLGYNVVPCEGKELERVGQFVTATSVGCALMLLKRSAIERMIAAYPEKKYTCWTGQTQFALFDPTLVDDKYLSEDIAFCRLWRALGGKIWIDTEGKIDHIGMHTFHGQGLKL